MSREIKFRAWDTVRRKIMLNIHSEKYSDMAGRMPFSYLLREPSFIVEQFTGLKDKNGKEIYEGDIVKDPQGNVGEVFYLRTSWMVRWHRRDGSWDTDSCIEYGEVIGNTHENPELLK